MNLSVAERFLNILQNYNLFDQDNDEALQNLENYFLISPLAEQLLPDRYVSFVEPIDDEYGYTRVIQQLAEITNGDWKPTNIVETYDETTSQEQEDTNITVIEFDFAGQHFKWAINQYAYRNDICQDFHKALYDFAQDYLNGVFIKLPVSDPSDDFVYLPKEVAKDFKEVVLALSSEEIVYLTKRFFELEIFGMMMLKEFCLQFDFKDINQVDAQGDLALNIAVRAQVNGKYAADEVVNLLLDRGAQPYIPDSHGQTALDIAKNDKNLVELLALFKE